MTRIPAAILVIATMLALAPSVAAQPKKTPLPPTPPKAAAPAPAETDTGKVDLAYGAFQRGYYLTALAEATKRAEKNDPQAMTLIAEIYAQGLGVGRDDAKAAEWFKLAAAHGDRDAMFALAVFNFQGRGDAAQSGGRRQAFERSRQARPSGGGL